MKIIQDVFGATYRGEPVHRYQLCNPRGMVVSILDLGGIIQSIQVPDGKGLPGEVTLGCDSVADYERSGAYFGAIIGRCANRIARGRLNVNGQSLELTCNNGSNHLHGGCEGFDRKTWRVEQKRSDAECSLILQYTSVDGE